MEIKISKREYINKMHPHLLAQRAKKMRIKPTQKAKWKQLSNQIHEELNERYENSDVMELVEDMSYKKPYSPSFSVLPINIEMNDAIVDWSLPANYWNREWIRHNRLQLLEIAKKEEKLLAILLNDRGIRSFQKTPFVVDDKVLFVNLILPDYNVILEIRGNNKAASSQQAQRWRRLQKIGYKIINVVRQDILDINRRPQFLERLNEQLRTLN